MLAIQTCNVHPGFAWTASVVTPPVRGRAKRVQRRKKAVVSTACVARFNSIPIPTKNVMAARAMAMAPVNSTMAFPVRIRMNAWRIASMVFAAETFVREPASRVPRRSKEMASTVPVVRSQLEPIRMENAREVSAMERACVTWAAEAVGPEELEEVVELAGAAEPAVALFAIPLEQSTANTAKVTT